METMHLFLTAVLIQSNWLFRRSNLQFEVVSNANIRQITYSGPSVVAVLL